ncbi:hypothetical protein [Pandoravirus japonicus]|uniref:Uncharacterized protein n=1 Tax=Pandoravirus japonicus TaxID=2823154 RepID=A0A811BMT8_9VIRU|nr:hypothetical protein [Pandoravirus japonicus]
MKKKRERRHRLCFAKRFIPSSGQESTASKSRHHGKGKKKRKIGKRAQMVFLENMERATERDGDNQKAQSKV